MKYLLLFIALFMVSNVKAGLYLFDNEYYSDDMLKETVTMCKLKSFPPGINLKDKAKICMVAAFTKKTDLSNEEKLKSSNKYKLFALKLEMIQYTARACNFNDSEEFKKPCDYIKKYKDECELLISKTAECFIVLENYKK